MVAVDQNGERERVKEGFDGAGPFLVGRIDLDQLTDEGHFSAGNSEAFGNVVAPGKEFLGDGRRLPDEAGNFLFVCFVFAFYGRNRV